VLNEAYLVKDDKFKFKQVLQNSSFHDYDNLNTEYDIQITESNIQINWNVAFWLNQFGIENFIINAESVEGTYSLELYDKHSDKLEQTIDKNIADIQWNFVVEDATLNKGNSLYISYLVFNFKNNNCTITF
jgi:hypothetical protein